MSAPVTVKRFAEQIGVSEDRLLQQLYNAGVLDKTIDGDLDDADRTRLLYYLRRKSTKIYNSFGNWWYEDDVCRELTCDTLINDCDNKYNAGTSPSANGIAKPLRIYRCPDHYYSNSKRLTDMRETHPITGQRKQNYKQSKAFQLGGKRGEPDWQDYLDRTEIMWNEEIKGHLLNTVPAKECFNWVDSQKESVIRLVTSPVKSRDKTQYDKLKELYNYTCQVESCHETEVEFAHILKHSLPNSVDNPTNGWCICRNHHKAYDSNRMIVEVNGDFVRYDVHGNIIERHGRIIYNDLHKVNPMFITLAREHHDREK